MIKLVVLSVGFLSAGDILANTPEQVVTAFQRDYKYWNDQSFQRNQNDGKQEVMLQAQKGWNELLKKYTKAGFQGEPIAFGSESSHDPEQEKIISVQITEKIAVVTTKLSRQYYSPIYEYQLSKENDTWYLSQIFLVDDDGKYPSL
ncbi:hypothetical protein [Citrobacter portucalensis]|uniref:hypothetical protein n=1 Tax=Citrobacter portucalensis TaxID=1639133 RepID=UPI00388F8E8D